MIHYVSFSSDMNDNIEFEAFLRACNLKQSIMFHNEMIDFYCISFDLLDFWNLVFENKASSKNPKSLSIKEFLEQEKVSLLLTRIKL